MEKPPQSIILQTRAILTFSFSLHRDLCISPTREGSRRLRNSRSGGVIFYISSLSQSVTQSENCWPHLVSGARSPGFRIRPFSLVQLCTCTGTQSCRPRGRKGHCLSVPMSGGLIRANRRGLG